MLFLLETVVHCTIEPIPARQLGATYYFSLSSSLVAEAFSCMCNLSASVGASIAHSLCDLVYYLFLLGQAFSTRYLHEISANTRHS